jgi:hypothetical protein
MTTYSAIEAVIKEGIIYPIEPEKLPRDGKLIIMIVLEDEQNMGSFSFQVGSPTLL